ncbi:Methyltransferase TYW3-like protein [Elsinoe fawcettii]|nr:Methyltransferase TYW3-like protein [Elsinoe fawcettii]
MTSQFKAKKAKILEQLSVPFQEYTDASPKGSVDAPIQFLVQKINEIETLVTTSSCSGRIAVYIEGLKAGGDEVSPGEASSGQGKGGGSWLFVSHTPVEQVVSLNRFTLQELLDCSRNESHVSPDSGTRYSTDLTAPIPSGARLVHFKFEPLILHILCASLPAARKVLIAAQGAGFRESGISSVPEPPPQSPAPSSIADDLPKKKTTTSHDLDHIIEDSTKRQYPKRQRKSQKQTQEGPVMVAVRTTGLAMDAPIGFLSHDGIVQLSISDAYLSSLVTMGNRRFISNEERKQRLADGITKTFQRMDR